MASRSFDVRVGKLAGGSQSGGTKIGTYTGPALIGVDEFAVSAGRFTAYANAVTAGGASLNTFRIYRKMSAGTAQITASDVTQHNAGRLLVHSLRTDNTSDVEGGVAVSAWRGVADGLHDNVLNAIIAQVAALNFGVGKPQYVFTSLDPETGRFVNGQPAADHGTPAEFIAAHRHFYNLIQASAAKDRLLLGFCDQWFYYQDLAASGRGSVTAACYPGDAFVDLSLGDLTYNKSSSKSSWTQASSFIADYRAWVTKYGFMSGKQIMCIEGDCEDWFTAGWPSGSVASDPTQKANWFRNFGQFIHDTPDFIGYAYWDDVYPINSTSQALAGFVDMAGLAQAP